MQRQLQEVIVAAAGPSSASQGSGTVNLYDLSTGSSLLTLKQTLAAKNCSVATQTRDGQGGLVLAAQSDKGLLNVYSYQKDQLHLKIVLPEKLSCLAVDPNGDYCAGGTHSGRVYLWEIASGVMFNSWEAHYRHIGVIQFTSDGAALVTGSDDSTVSVWTMASLLDNASSSDIPDAFYTLTDHTLPITGLVCGVGIFPRCRILTSSLDNTCKIIDLGSRTILSTFQFPCPITSIALDVTERILFASSAEGQIHQVNLFRPRKENFSQRKENPEALGGGGHGSVEMVGFEEDAENKRLIQVGSPVNCIRISLTSSCLIVGTARAQILVFDIHSHQLIRTINTPKEFSVNSIQVMLKPQDLMGHATISASAGKNDNTIPIRSISAFQRTRDPRSREAHELPNLLPTSVQRNLARSTGPTESDLLDDQRFFISPSLSTSSSLSGPVLNSHAAGPAATARINELETELAAMKTQLARAQDINTSMYETALTAIFGDKAKKDSGVVGGRPSKRGRTE